MQSSVCLTNLNRNVIENSLQQILPIAHNLCGLKTHPLLCRSPIDTWKIYNVLHWKHLLNVDFYFVCAVLENWASSLPLLHRRMRVCAQTHKYKCPSSDRKVSTFKSKSNVITLSSVLQSIESRAFFCCCCCRHYINRTICKNNLATLFPIANSNIHKYVTEVVFCLSIYSNSGDTLSAFCIVQNCFRPLHVLHSNNLDFWIPFFTDPKIQEVFNLF